MNEKQKILDSKNPTLLYEYARDVIKGRWPEAEPFIATHPQTAYYYAQHIIEGRWPEGEKAIAQDAAIACSYAIFVIHDRFPEGEAVIAQDTEQAYDYAYHVMKGRFLLGEKAIAQDKEYADSYAYDHDLEMTFSFQSKNKIKEEEKKYVLAYIAEAEHKYFKEQNLYLGTAILTDDINNACLMTLEEAESYFSYMNVKADWEIWSVKIGLSLDQPSTRHLLKMREQELKKQLQEVQKQLEQK
jgi:hypothetical protein